MDSTDHFCRILFIDFTKAFDLVDHNVLFRKFSRLNFPPHVTTWFLSFLSDRRQYVSLGSSSSDLKTLQAGTPQGTLSGPCDFNLMINDLLFDHEYVKYVDDTSIAAVSSDPLDDTLQKSADKLISWCIENGMKINSKKTQEMLLYFGSKYPKTAVPSIIIDGTKIERVHKFKLLGVIFNSHLNWNDHIDYILTKASKRIFLLANLLGRGSVASMLLLFIAL